MRIDAFQKVDPMYQTNKTRKLSSINSTNSPDRVEISQIGKDYTVAKQAVAAAPDIREDRVNAIKERMASGTYNVSAQDVAARLLENTFELSV